MLCKEEPRHTTASLTDGHQLQSSPAQLQQLRTSWEIDGIGIALSPHIERRYYLTDLIPQIWSFVYQTSRNM